MDRARPEVSAPDFWQALYQSGQDGWELGAPAPALVGWLEGGGAFASAEPGRPPRVAVPGCGRGRDAHLLAARGAEAWGFDFAASALAEARALDAPGGGAAHFEERDVFTLAEDRAGFFDGVWEYTCFCAIDPGRRAEYVATLRAILRPGGLLLACFYPLRDGDGGPPFPVARDEIARLLAPGFDVRAAGPPARSAERRGGLEWLVAAARR